MSKFKVGDKVRVVSGFTAEDYPQVGWVDDMAEHVGTVTTVLEVRDIVGVPCCLIPDSKSEDSWVWPCVFLEPAADDPAIQAEAEAIIRDAMRFRSLLDKRSTGRSDMCIARRNWFCEEDKQEWEMLFDDELLEAVDEHMEKLAKLG